MIYKNNKMIVTKIVLEKSKKDYIILTEWEKKHNIESILDMCLLVNESSNFDIFYLFTENEVLVDSLMNIAVENSVIIKYREDYTEKLIKKFIYNEIDDFKSNFDEYSDISLLDDFYKKNINIDIILDKMLDNGKESLTEKDYAVLNDSSMARIN